MLDDTKYLLGFNETLTGYTGIQSTVIVPNKIKRIKTCFVEIPEIKKIILNNDLNEIDYEAFFGLNITEIDIPSSVEFIASGAFISCPKLKKITLHEGLRTIMANAFDSLPIEVINIPSSVYYLSTNSFANCKNLKTINLYIDDSDSRSKEKLATIDYFKKMLKYKTEINIIYGKLIS
jgi:hypothetical protein